MLALIDADLVAYRCAASAENDDAGIALYRVDKLMQEIIGDVGASNYRGFLTGSNNFRKALTPDYKANRKGKPLPVHLQTCREFLVNNWKVTVTDGYEADDALGMHQRTAGTIICSLDKDLRQVPGQHYNWVKKEFFSVTPEEGLLSFYTSVLVGDRSDNIVGINGIGPVKAGKVFSNLSCDEYYSACKDLYQDDERLHLNCKLLWIWRKQDDIWTAPDFSHSDTVHEEGSATELVKNNET